MEYIAATLGRTYIFQIAFAVPCTRLSSHLEGARMCYLSVYALVHLEPCTWIVQVYMQARCCLPSQIEAIQCQKDTRLTGIPLTKLWQGSTQWRVDYVDALQAGERARCKIWQLTYTQSTY